MTGASTLAPVNNYFANLCECWLAADCVQRILAVWTQSA
jgi:hypothetical protein